MLPSLRQSTIRSWLTCRAEFYEKFVLGLPQEFIPVLELGTHYHKEVENYHRGQPYDAALIASYVEAVKPVPGELIEYEFSYIPRHPIFGTELDIPFTGTIDRVNPGEALRDFKTSSSSWSQTKADKALPDLSGWYPDTSGLQATAYCMYWWQEHGELLPFDFVVLRKDTKKDGSIYPVKSVRTVRTVEQFAQFFDLCQQVITDIQTETAWACTCINQRHSLKGINA
jgi:hypothetical protein